MKEKWSESRFLLQDCFSYEPRLYKQPVSGVFWYHWSSWNKKSAWWPACSLVNLQKCDNSKPNTTPRTGNTEQLVPRRVTPTPSWREGFVEWQQLVGPMCPSVNEGKSAPLRKLFWGTHLSTCIYISITYLSMYLPTSHWKVPTTEEAQEFPTWANKQIHFISVSGLEKIL